MEKKGITQKNESFDSVSKLKPVLVKKSFNGAQKLSPSKKPSNNGSGSSNQQQTQSNNQDKKK